MYLTECWFAICCYVGNICRLVGGIEFLLPLSRLETLILDNNQLSDNILTSQASGVELPWSQLSRLRLLYMHKNKIVGSFPAQLAMIPTLRMLNLSNNEINGLLPDNIGELTSLRTLILSGNRITGPVPRSIANLKLLRDFDLFKPYPATHSKPPRGFCRRVFERIFEYGPEAQLNSVHWDPGLLYGPDARVQTPVSILTRKGATASNHNNHNHHHREAGSISSSASLASEIESVSSTVATATRFESHFK